METYVLIAILGAVIAADITVFGQFMLSQPIVSAAIAGAIFGYPEAALTVGLTMQLLWLKLVPAGGSVYLNGNLGSFTAFAVYALCRPVINAPDSSLLFVCLVFGILSSYLYGTATTVQRRMNQAALPYVHKAVENGSRLRFQVYHVSGALSTAAGGGLLVVAVSFAGEIILGALPESLYFTLAGYAGFGITALMGIGAGTVLSMIWEKRAIAYPLAGIAAGILVLLLF